MTCVVAIVDGSTVWMGADSLGVSGHETVMRRDEKVFALGSGPDSMIVGFAGSFRMGQALRYGFVPPEHPDGMDEHEYMVLLFVEAVRERFTKAGFNRTENGVDSGGFFLVGYRGRLFSVESDYQVGEPAITYFAIGSGAQIALGSLYSTDPDTLTPRERLIWALEAASAFNASVGGDFRIGCAPPPAPVIAICPQVPGFDLQSETDLPVAACDDLVCWDAPQEGLASVLAEEGETGFDETSPFAAIDEAAQQLFAALGATEAATEPTILPEMSDATTLSLPGWTQQREAEPEQVWEPKPEPEQAPEAEGDLSAS
jgi:ATP-dependent protease HslVU (ClpYQ) peptidase subunit